MMLLMLLACGSSDDDGSSASAPESELQEIRLALNWFPEPEFGGFYEGVLGGHYERAGFNVEIIPGGPGAPTLELLGSGKAEAAISAGDDLLIKRSKGIQAIGVYPAFQNSPQGLLAHSVTGIESAADIPTGSTISIEVGSPFQQHLWATYSWEGQMEAVPYAGLVGSFMTDESSIQQAYITSEPCIVRSKGGSPVFLEARSTGWNPYGSLLALPEPLPQWAPAFVAATHAGWEAYIASPEAANKAMLDANDQLTPELMDCIVDAQKPFLTGEDGLGKMTINRWSSLNDHLVALELLPEGSDSTTAWKSLLP